MPIQFAILGSGSSGNCAYLETEETRLLIDAGLSGKQIRLRLASLGKTPETLTGILITHEHSDHVQGLKRIAADGRIPVYCNRHTRRAVEEKHGCEYDCRIFQTGSSFEVGDLRVDSFTVPHDALDPVGYVVHAGDEQIGILTDLGHITRLILDRIRQVTVLVLDANYDPELLRQDPKRPWSIKQRIYSRHGHLSNESAAKSLAELGENRLKYLFLAHLSQDCNTPELAHRTFVAHLNPQGLSPLNVIVAERHRLTEPIRLASAQASVPQLC